METSKPGNGSWLMTVVTVLILIQAMLLIAKT